MALKKSEICSSLWQSCDNPWTGILASLHDDVVLDLLFTINSSNCFTCQPSAPATEPDGEFFEQKIAHKGKPDIGNNVNSNVYCSVMSEYHQSDFMEFDDADCHGVDSQMRLVVDSCADKVRERVPYPMSTASLQRDGVLDSMARTHGYAEVNSSSWPPPDRIGMQMSRVFAA